MDIFGLEPGEIAELGTQVAAFGAMQARDVGDGVFELIVSITALIYEVHP